MRNSYLWTALMKARHYCLVAIMLSIAAAFSESFAQSRSVENLEDLAKRLEELGGEAGKLSGQLGIGSAIDDARSDAVEGFARSPFSSPESGVPPELNTSFLPAERLLISQFCRGEIAAIDAQVLRILEEFSQVERDYCQRIGDSLFQTGYRVFDGVISPDVLVNGAIQDDYLLGIGDQMIVIFEGVKTGDSKVWVDREGQILLEDIGRIPAAGRTFGEFRNALKDEVKRSMFGTEVSVSMGSVRLASVRVTGEVRKPGVHQLTGLSTIFDALTVAGGIKKSGSLRRVQVQRGDRIFWVDVYDLMYPSFGGQNFGVRDGDHILIPALGTTIAVAGEVKTPGIFELAEGQRNISVADALVLAGLPVRPRGNVYTILSFDDSGRELVEETDEVARLLGAGDILLVKRRENMVVGTVEIDGHVRNPGRRSLASAPTIRALVGDQRNVGDDPYLLFAVLETNDPATRARRLFPVNLGRILLGEQDYALRDRDRLIVFSQQEIRYLSSDDVRRVISPEIAIASAGSSNQESAKDVSSIVSGLVSLSEKNGADSGGVTDASKLTSLIGEKPGTAAVIQDSIRAKSCPGLRSLATILRFTRSNRFESALQALGVTSAASFVNPRPCPQVFHEIPDLLPFALEHAVAVNGEVRIPGAYPVTNGTRMSSLIAVVGGLTRESDPAQVEVTRFQASGTDRSIVDLTRVSARDVTIDPGNVARFNALFTDRDSGPVLLSGEFVRPGLYDIRRGERMSDLMTRAGGLTDQAYPYGAIFTRERVKIAQKEGFQRAARELKSAAMFSAGRKAVEPGAMLALLTLSDEIAKTEPLGRVVIEADPTVLQVRPELDSVLEPGDQIFMPKRPNSVLVIGDTLNPGALQFVSGTKVDEYVQQAGGLQQSADEDRMFLVYPNGVAQPVSVSVWNYNPVQVPPGSTVVVPKNPAPIDIFSFAKDMTALISQMAITAASLAVIGNN